MFVVSNQKNPIPPKSWQALVLPTKKHVQLLGSISCTKGNRQETRRTTIVKPVERIRQIQKVRQMRVHKNMVQKKKQDKTKNRTVVTCKM